MHLHHHHCLCFCYIKAHLCQHPSSEISSVLKAETHTLNQLQYSPIREVITWRWLCLPDKLSYLTNEKYANYSHVLVKFNFLSIWKWWACVIMCTTICKHTHVYSVYSKQNHSGVIQMALWPFFSCYYCTLVGVSAALRWVLLFVPFGKLSHIFFSSAVQLFPSVQHLQFRLSILYASTYQTLERYSQFPAFVRMSFYMDVL